MSEVKPGNMFIGELQIITKVARDTVELTFQKWGTEEKLKVHADVDKSFVVGNIFVCTENYVHRLTYGAATLGNWRAAQTV